uniref:Uncharacterized protein n=1 Tax=Ovis aries TaxID=9940 RepID=A0AC11CLU0_SHEEP
MTGSTGHTRPKPQVLALGFCVPGVIIGGTESKAHSRPYMAYLEIVTSQGKQKACSGFLIRRDFVLMAAHCAGRSVTVTLGAHNIQKKEDTWQRLEVIKQFPYPKYDPVGLHDIMLLKLKEKANLTLAVGTLPLPPHVTFIRPRRMCQVAGWGRTGVKEPASSTLQEVKLRLMEPRGGGDGFLAHLLSLPFLLFPQGDSGGPLLCAGVAQGIVSYGLFSAKPPAVFTWISPYRPWIDEVLKEN